MIPHVKLSDILESAKRIVGHCSRLVVEDASGQYLRVSSVMMPDDFHEVTLDVRTESRLKRDVSCLPRKVVIEGQDDELLILHLTTELSPSPNAPISLEHRIEGKSCRFSVTAVELKVPSHCIDVLADLESPYVFSMAFGLN